MKKKSVIKELIESQESCRAAAAAEEERRVDEWIGWLSARANTDIKVWTVDHSLDCPDQSPEILNRLDKIMASRAKIEELERELAAQKKALIAAERALRAYRHKTTPTPETPQARHRGRPKVDAVKRERARHFTALWVKSLQQELDVKISDLEEFVPGTSERNWRRWENGEATPTAENLRNVVETTVGKGNHKGKLLVDIPTNPRAKDLLALINLL